MAEGDSCVAQLHDRHLSAEDVGNQSRQLCEVFFIDRLHSIDERKRRGDTLSADEIRGAERAASIQLVDIHKPGAPVGPQLPEITKITNCLGRIGDQLDGNPEFDDLLDSIALENVTKDMFFKVAMQLFPDGTFTWDRVSAFFYFAYRLVLRDQISDPLIRTIIDWVVSFVLEKMATWIIGKGGWEAVVEYFSPTQRQLATMMIGAVISVGMIWWKNRRSKAS